MADSSIIHDYLDATCHANGARAAALFTEDGVLDDYRGAHRVGRGVIRQFIDARPRRTVDILSEIVHDGPRLTVYAHVNYEDGHSKTLRFIFTAPGSLIEHLGNSAIEFVPPELRITPLAD